MSAAWIYITSCDWEISNIFPGTSRIRIRFYDKTQFQFISFLGFSHMICFLPCFLLKQQWTKRKRKYFYDLSYWMSVMLYEIIFRRTLLGLWNNLKLFLTSTSERGAWKRDGKSGKTHSLNENKKQNSTETYTAATSAALKLMTT